MSDMLKMSTGEGREVLWELIHKQILLANQKFKA